VSVRGPAGLPTLSRRSKVVIWIGVAVLILLLVGPRAVSLITDWLWFSDIGYTEVFSTIIWTRIIVFLVAAVVTGLIVFAAIAVAYRSRSVFVPSGIGPDPLARYRTTVMSRVRWFAVLPPVLIGVLAGLVAQGSWSTVQVFLKGESFGVKDPQFGLDVGFYAFDLPFWRFVLNLLFVIVVVAFVVNLLTHYLFGSIRLGGGGVAPSISMSARVQLSVLAGIFLLLKAVAYWLDRYALLSSERKQETFTGMSYTDANAVLSSKLILMAIAIICAVAFFAGVVLRDLRVPALATVLMLVSALLIGVGWPLAVEQFSVKPNAAQKEAKYIARNIEATEQAYGIGEDNVTVRDNWASTDPDPATVNGDKATLSNIRILDPNIVSGTYTQLQQRQNFYGFPSQLSIDRYKVDGELRDYVVAVREIDPDRLAGDQANWLNKHLTYTHGNGFVAAPANTVRKAAADENDTQGSGEPDFLVGDLSNYRSEEYRKNSPIKVTEPRIYFGELISKGTPDYAIVGSDGAPAREYDTDNTKYTYQGDSGVSLGNWLNRFMYSVKFGERNFLLSSEINKNSTILYNRDPRDRVKKAAPWLTVDSKTYPAVMSDGSIKWIVDGYTTLESYPYAQKTSLQALTTDAQELNRGQTGRTQVNRTVSYVRNSVKATVDAYSGEVKLYQFDDKDPVLKTWMKVFPGTVETRAEFDKQGDLRDHVRYPEDLFKIQRTLLARYHVKDPQAFFQGSQFWSVPADPTNEQADRQGLDQPPYYFVAADPDDKRSSFQLTSVMTRLNRPILGAYMTASSDPDDYGRITLRTLPLSSQRVGPKQAFNPMKADPRVSENLKNLENTATTQFGNLLTLPVGDNGVLYVMPLYVQAKGEGSYPRLFRIVTQYQDKIGSTARIGYASTTAGALAQVGIDPENAVTVPGETTTPNQPEGNQQGTTTPPATSGGQSSQRDNAVAAMGSALDELKAAQQAGDFTAYGEALDKLQQAVDAYENAGG
jgi:uncharacterized membrane protein (UPF0182 family)